MDTPSRLRSVTQEKDLDEFLNTAQLAGTEFTAGTSYAPYPVIAHPPPRAPKREDCSSLCKRVTESLPTFSRGRNILLKETE